MFHTLRKRKSLSIILMVVGLVFSTLSLAHTPVFTNRVTPNTHPIHNPTDRKVVTAYIHKVNPKLNKKSIDKLMTYVDRNVKMYGLPEDLQLGLIALESGFNPHSQGPTHDFGYWQVVPRYHKKMIDRMYRQGIIKNKDMLDPDTNSAVGGKVLFDCLLKNDWYTKPALLCYNGSIRDKTAKYSKLVLKRVNKVVWNKAVAHKAIGAKEVMVATVKTDTSMRTKVNIRAVNAVSSDGIKSETAVHHLQETHSFLPEYPALHHADYVQTGLQQWTQCGGVLEQHSSGHLGYPSVVQHGQQEIL